VQKEVAEVRKLISDFPKEQLEVIKDCLSTNVGSGAAGALLKKGQVKSFLWSTIQIE
jgi:hypothetical protein